MILAYLLPIDIVLTMDTNTIIVHVLSSYVIGECDTKEHAACPRKRKILFSALETTYNNSV